MTKITVDKALIEQAIEALHYGECMYPNGGTALMIIKAAKESLQSSLTSEPQCNPHPKAPHGFNRNGSHSAGRYVCDCESWDPYDSGYNAGFQAALSQEALAEPVVEPRIDRDALTVNLMRVAGIDKHKARECADVVGLMPASPPPPAEPVVEMCPCKYRPASECPGEWEPGCDLGSNEAHALPVNQCDRCMADQIGQLQEQNRWLDTKLAQQQAVMRQALEALKNSNAVSYGDLYAIKALEDALK